MNSCSQVSNLFNILHYFISAVEGRGEEKERKKQYEGREREREKDHVAKRENGR